MANAVRLAFAEAQHSQLAVLGPDADGIVHLLQARTSGATSQCAQHRPWPSTHPGSRVPVARQMQICGCMTHAAHLEVGSRPQVHHAGGRQASQVAHVPACSPAVTQPASHGRGSARQGHGQTRAHPGPWTQNPRSGPAVLSSEWQHQLRNVPVSLQPGGQHLRRQQLGAAAPSFMHRERTSPSWPARSLCGACRRRPGRPSRWPGAGAGAGQPWRRPSPGAP